MANKGSSGTTTHTQIRKILRTAAEPLSAREEKAVRMRTGTGIDAEAALHRRGTEVVALLAGPATTAMKGTGVSPARPANITPNPVAMSPENDVRNRTERRFV